MRKIGCTGRSLASALLAAALLSIGAADAQNLTVYDDALQNGFTDWGWAPDRNLADTSQHHSGSSSISFSSDASWQGVILHGSVDASSYDALLVWVRGSAAGLQYSVSLDGAPSTVSLATYTGGSIPANGWALATIPFSAFGLASGGGASGITFQAQGTQARIYLDDIALRALPAVPLSVTVDPNGPRRAIDPLIYGVAHFGDAGSSQLPYPARRWGGNAVTRYNWEIDVQNRASDWFFENIPNGVANPAQLPNNSTADLWVDSTLAHGGEAVLTVPTIGWAPKGSNPATDRVVTWGYSVAKYGAQREHDPGRPDAGSGCTPSSPPNTCTFLAVTPDPTDTSKAVTPAYFVSWLNHLAGRVGKAAGGGVKYLILDNEPMLWSSTHHDVHPGPVTYDELWQKSRDSAAAFKAFDPDAKVLAGASWGWCEYFNSSRDSSLYGACGPNAVTDPASDYATHGNTFWLPYLLQQGEAYRQAHGTRLIDYLDVHYYPQSGAVFSSDESSATAALRLRSLKSLHDPSYVDESWIGQPVNLIPRMKAWIAQYAPGTKLAINEYNFGDGTGASSAIAQAEALAIFGREGVDMANRWVVPDAGSLIEDAFRLYLNYDGAGAKVAGDSVPATSANVNQVGAYAVRGRDKLYVLLFNKDTASHDVPLTVSGAGTATASLWRLGATPLASAGTASVSAGAVTLTLPARTATLAVLPYVPPPLKLHTLTPCRVLDTRNAAGPYGGPALANGDVKNVRLAGRCGVPGSARAVSLNVTTVPSGTGSFKLTPGDLAPQTATSLSFAAGKTRANMAVLATSADGYSSVNVGAVLSSGTAHVIVDVNGYFE